MGATIQMDKVSFSQRRKHVRLMLSLPMQVQWVNNDGRMFNVSCKSINISVGGVYYRSHESLPLGTDTIVTFDLPFNNNATDFGALRTRGQVVRVEETETKEKGIALKFLEELQFLTSYND